MYLALPKQTDYLAIAKGVSSRSVHGVEVLRNRKNVLVCRVQTPWNESVIIKLWNRPAFNGVFRRATGTSPLAREFRTLYYMARFFDDSPRAIGSYRLRGEHIRHTEALVVSDLGRCKNAADYFKEVLSSENSEAMHHFEERIVTITQRLLAGHFVDTDHRISNFVVPPVQPTHSPDQSASPIRIDFEHSVRVLSLTTASGILGRMIGTLIGSHVYLTQPYTNRSKVFVERLFDSIGPMTSRRALRVAQGTIDKMLDGQAERHGIATKFQI